MIHENSVTTWISAIRDGDSVAATELWERYFGQLLGQARRRMRTLPTAVYDEEDAAISTFRVLCKKLQEGAYPELADRDELWHLLLMVLARKINRRATYEKAAKRGQTVSLDHPGEGAAAEPIVPDWNLVTGEAAEDCRILLEQLDDANLEKVAIWKLEGFTNEEIASKLDCSRRTVQRMLNLIRDLWSHEATSR